MPKLRATAIKAEDTFGERLRQERTWRNLSQRDLAERLNITSAAISAYEKGKASPTLERMRQIADVFKCPISKLYVDWRETERRETV